MKLGIQADFYMTYDPQFNLRHLVASEKAGFDHLWLGDHFLPWHHSFKPNFFVWSLLPVVASKTRSIGVGVNVTVPIGGRYHPAIIAQASATIERMFPHRFSLGVGSGEAMSESRFLDTWPKWNERIEKLIEGIDLIRKLWTSNDFFSFDGKYFRMQNVVLYLRPKTAIPIYFSGQGKKSAFLAGKHSNTFMTYGTVEQCRDLFFPRFEEGAKSVGRRLNMLEKAVQINGGIGDEHQIFDRIRKLVAGATLKKMFEEKDPREIEAQGKKLTDEHIARTSYVCEKPDQLSASLPSLEFRQFLFELSQ